jgi:hypothetical protein
LFYICLKNYLFTQIKFKEIKIKSNLLFIYSFSGSDYWPNGKLDFPLPESLGSNPILDPFYIKIIKKFIYLKLKIILSKIINPIKHQIIIRGVSMNQDIKGLDVVVKGFTIKTVN